MTLSRIARVGTGILFAFLIASIVLVGNQRLAMADVPPFPDVPSGSDINSSLDVPSGEEIVCQVFSDLNEVGSPIPVFTTGCGTRGALEVKKIVSGGTASPSNFQIHVQGEGNNLSNTGSASGRTYGNLKTGSYTVSESGGPSGYVASFSGDCNSSGSVTVSAGVKKTCTITNTFVGSGGGNNGLGNKPKLTVTKVVVNNGGGTAVVSDFSLSATLSFEGFSESIGLASGVETELTTPGTWVVSEEAKANYVGTFSGDCDADGKVTLLAGESKNCTLTNTYTPGNNQSTGGGSTSGGSSGGSRGGGESPVAASATTTSPAGQVLGAAATSITACDQYLTAFIRTGKVNDVEQVKRLQAVLIEFEKAPGVEITGVYDAATLAAVHVFQTKYASEILTPWGIKESTGFVYLTTRKKVNEIYCKGTKIFPLTSEEQSIVEKARTGKTAPAQTQAAPKVQTEEKQQASQSSSQEAGRGVSNTSQGGSFWDRLKGLLNKIR